MGGSSDDAGLFEFGQLSDSGSDDDPPDTPDESDPPDSGADDENTSEHATGNDGQSAEDANSEDGDPPDPPDDGSASNEPAEAGDSPETGGSAADDSSSSDSESADGDGSSDGDSSSGNDAPDPPDPSDGGSESKFYEFDPVDESQKAFQFAEKQSRAAAESAYKRAAGSLLGELVQKYTSPEVRERLDEVFSRRMLGSVLVGGAFTKILESSVELFFGAAGIWRPLMWATIFLLSTLIFVWWDHLSRRASEAAEKASETAEKATEAASEAAEKASETAEKASQAATGKSPESETAEVVGAGIAQAVQNREGGATAATRAGGRRPTAVRSRSRAPERRPNKRFEGEDNRFEGEPGESVPSDEVVGDAEDEVVGPVFEGGRFKDPGDAENP